MGLGRNERPAPSNYHPTRDESNRLPPNIGDHDAESRSSRTLAGIRSLCGSARDHRRPCRHTARSSCTVHRCWEEQRNHLRAEVNGCRPPLRSGCLPCAWARARRSSQTTQPSFRVPVLGVLILARSAEGRTRSTDAPIPLWASFPLRNREGGRRDARSSLAGGRSARRRGRSPLVEPGKAPPHLDRVEQNPFLRTSVSPPRRRVLAVLATLLSPTVTLL